MYWGKQHNKKIIKNNKYSLSLLIGGKLYFVLFFMYPILCRCMKLASGLVSSMDDRELELLIQKY